MQNALQPNTTRTYSSIIRRFLGWAQTRWDPRPWEESMVYDYLSTYCDARFTFGYVRAQYCALRFYFKRAHPSVTFTPYYCDDFLNGAQKKCKRFLKTLYTWDPQEYVDFVNRRTQPKTAAQASRETAAILMLAKGIRSADLLNMYQPKIDRHVVEDELTLRFINRQKTVGAHGQQLEGIKIPAYPDYPRVCPVLSVRNYLLKSKAEYHKKGWKRPDVLFVSATTEKPIEPSTLRNWLCEELAEAGIVGPEGKKYTAHSFRAASTSADYFKNFSFDRIQACAGWKSTSTFAKYYQRRIISGPECLLPFPSVPFQPDKDLDEAPVVEEDAKQDGFCYNCLSFRCMTPNMSAAKLKELELRNSVDKLAE